MHIFLLLLSAIRQDEFIFFIPSAHGILLLPLGWQLLLLKSAKPEQSHYLLPLLPLLPAPVIYEPKSRLGLLRALPISKQTPK